MLFCQQKNLKYKALVLAFVFALHWYVVWFICLKTVIHHFVIPLSTPKSLVRIKLNKSVSAVKKNIVSSKKPEKSMPVQVVQKKSKTLDKNPAQKPVAQKVIHKHGTVDHNLEKKNELKKTAASEVQKKVQPKEKEIVSVQKSENVPSFNSTQQLLPEAKIDHAQLPEQTMPSTNYYDVVYSTIIDQWRPPVGIVKGTSCVVSFLIDKKGFPIDIVFEKKSGILMFDMSIKTVLARVNFSSLFVGHRFSIVFTV